MRYSAYDFRLLSIIQMTVASFRITGTRAMVIPSRRLIRLYHARSRASFRNALRVTCAKSQRAVLLLALVIFHNRRLFSPLLRQPGVKPQ